MQGMCLGASCSVLTQNASKVPMNSRNASTLNAVTCHFSPRRGSSHYTINELLNGQCQAELLARSLKINSNISSVYFISDCEISSELLTHIRTSPPSQGRLTLSVIQNFAQFFASRPMSGPWLVCDPDVLLMKPGIEAVFNDNFDVAITRRADSRMPYNSGVVFINDRFPNTGERFFRLQEKIILSEFPNESEWFGDQLVLTEIIDRLAQCIEDGLYDFCGLRIKILDASIFNYSPEREHPYLLPPSKNVMLYHFKGRCRIYMKDFFRFFVQTRKWTLWDIFALLGRLLTLEWRRKRIKGIYLSSKERVMPSDR